MPTKLKMWLSALYIAVTAALWAVMCQFQYQTQGLFRWWAIDYGRYWAQAYLFWNGNRTDIYNTPALHKAIEALLPYTAKPLHPFSTGPVAYPPLFAWLMWPFMQVSPQTGYVLWTAASGAAALYLAWRAASFFPKQRRPLVTMLLLISFPFVFTLFVGQPMIYLGIAAGEAYLALRSGRDLRAGFWISALIFKPQYGVLIALLLLWKRRWKAVMGAALGVSLVIALSLILVGPDVLLTYRFALSDMADPTIEGATRQMINWRAIGSLAQYYLGVSGGAAAAFTALASIITVVIAAFVWRGPWDTGPHFGVRYLVLIMATLLAMFHSHGYGAILLTVPGADLIAHRRELRIPTALTWTLPALFFVPSLVFCLGAGYTTVVACFALLVLLVATYAIVTRLGILRPPT